MSRTTTHNILDQAYEAWDRSAYAEAAELFFRAAYLEAEDADQRPRWGAPDRTFLYRFRSACCQWLNGEHAEARPVLVEATTFDYKSNRLWADRYDSERAFTYLLFDHAANDNRTGFLDLWKKAALRGDQLKLPFPWISANYLELAEACNRVRYPEGIERIIDNLTSNKEMDSSLKNLLVKLQQLRERLS